MDLVGPLEGGIYWEELRSLADYPGKGDCDPSFFLSFFSFLDTIRWSPKTTDQARPTENSETMHDNQPAVFLLILCILSVTEAGYS